MIDNIREKQTTVSDMNYSVDELCKAFGVARSGYYKAKSAPESARARETKLIAERIGDTHSDKHTRCYGSPRMAAELTEGGLPCSENRAARIMRKNGINARQKAAFRPKTTISDPAAKYAPNYLKKAAPPTAPGQSYVSDITYVATREGWFYLATVMDLFSRKIAGWALDDHMETTLVTRALDFAVWSIDPAPDALFHSDRGCQYTSSAMCDRLALLGIKQSMSPKG